MSFGKFLAILGLTGGSAAVGAVGIYARDGVSLDVYGQVTAGFGNAAAATGIAAPVGGGSDAAAVGRSRLGLFGSAPLTPGVSAVMQLQEELSGTEEVQDPKLRYAYAGIDAERYGVLTAGRGDSAYYAVAGATDIFTLLDSRINDYYALGEQRSGQIMYARADLGWDFRASWQTAVRNLNDTFDVADGAAFSFAARLRPDISLTYGWAYDNFTYRSGNRAMTEHFRAMLPHTGNSAELPGYRNLMGAAAAWGVRGEGLYAALGLTVSKYQRFEHKIYSYEGVVSYAWDAGLAVSAGYGAQYYGHRLILAEATGALEYKLSPALKVFAEARWDVGSHPRRLYGESWCERQLPTEHKYVIGMQYAF